MGTPSGRRKKLRQSDDPEELLLIDSDDAEVAPARLAAAETRRIGESGPLEDVEDVDDDAAQKPLASSSGLTISQAIRGASWRSNAPTSPFFEAAEPLEDLDVVQEERTRAASDLAADDTAPSPAVTESDGLLLELDLAIQALDEVEAEGLANDVARKALTERQELDALRAGIKADWETLDRDRAELEAERDRLIRRDADLRAREDAMLHERARLDTEINARLTRELKIRGRTLDERAASLDAVDARLRLERAGVEDQITLRVSAEVERLRAEVDADREALRKERAAVAAELSAYTARVTAGVERALEQARIEVRRERELLAKERAEVDDARLRVQKDQKKLAGDFLDFRESQIHALATEITAVRKLREENEVRARVEGEKLAERREDLDTHKRRLEDQIRGLEARVDTRVFRAIEGAQPIGVAPAKTDPELAIPLDAPELEEADQDEGPKRLAMRRKSSKIRP